MEYLFLRRRSSNSISERQKQLLSKAVRKQWEEDFVRKGMEGRKIDFEIYRSLLYQMEIRMVFLDTSLSLDKLSALVGTNQTYMSNVVNRYFGCNLKELINSYRVEYAKELLRNGKCLMKDIPKRCGFASKSAFYSAFKKMTGYRPVEYIRRNGVEEKFGENN
jgi:AraC-like DNA-binding protein